MATFSGYYVRNYTQRNKKKQETALRYLFEYKWNRKNRRRVKINVTLLSNLYLDQFEIFPKPNSSDQLWNIKHRCNTKYNWNSRLPSFGRNEICLETEQHIAP